LRDDRRDFTVRVDIGTRPVPFSRDESLRRHLRSLDVAFEPRSKCTHHPEPARPGIVIGSAERCLPPQEQVDRNVIGSLTVSEAREDPWHALFERQVEAKASTDGKIVIKAL